VGGGVLGIGGMLLGVPIAAAIYQLFKNELNHNT
jgi:predicted PurR-regulated permease PerM